jgi:dTDP-4-dehydrorhamnose 3,5-epimerase
MRFEQTAVDGCRVVHLEPRGDARGWFARAWCAEEFAGASASSTIAQINNSLTADTGTIRGLHWQVAPHAEAKFVRCIGGAIFDVCVDVRPDSPTFRRWVGVELTPHNRLGLAVPEGCAHGYQTLAPDTEVLYTSSSPYASDAERGARFDDPAFGVEWPFVAVGVSDKDMAWPSFGS